MNIYEKLAAARAELKAAGIKQSGNNTYAGYTYFDLADILPATTRIEKELGLLSVVRYESDCATLTLYNSEKPEEFIEFTSPMSTAELKGCYPVQNLGAVETYVRRYLYLVAYEIVEAETLDKTQGDPDKAPPARKPSDGGQKPATGNAQQGQGNLTLERAEKMYFRSGKNANKPFRDLDDSSLKWAAENCDNIYGAAAKMVLSNRAESRKPPTIDDLQIRDDDLPF